MLATFSSLLSYSQFLLYIICFIFFLFFFFFFNDTATTEIYTLSLHDALPICRRFTSYEQIEGIPYMVVKHDGRRRSEEHTSELQSQSNLVCRLLLEKKKKKYKYKTNHNIKKHK